MVYKRIVNKTGMQPYILEGLNQISSIVGQTLGPGGLPILIQRVGNQLNGDPLGPMATKDGVSVANECYSPDPQVDVVIQAVKDICRKTNKEAGDGTTTAIVLGNAIMMEAMHWVRASSAINPQIIKEQIEASVAKVDQLLKGLAVPCKSLDMIEHVAKISANGDEEIASIIRGAFEAVGAEGVISVDEGSGKDHTLTVVNGFQIKRGAEGLASFFNNESMTKYEAENVVILIYDGKLQEMRQLLNVLDKTFTHYANIGKQMPPMLFIANEFSPDVLHALKVFRADQGLSVCAVKGPHTTTVRSAIYEDMAIFLGGKCLGNGQRNLMNFEIEDLGTANKVVSDKYTTTFFGGNPDEEVVIKRVDQLKAQREVAESLYDAQILSDRIAALSEGIAKIGVGGSTDIELKEKYHRIEDAVNAARAAVEEGIIPGGGSVLLRIANALKSENATMGDKILSKALAAPFYQILSNLGMDSSVGAAIEQELLKSSELTYDGRSKSVVKAIEAGIVDPVKVTRSALKNATSIASLLATLGGAIIYVKDSEPMQQPPQPQGDLNEMD